MTFNELGERYADALADNVALRFERDRLREALDHALKGDLDPEDRIVIAQILDGDALQGDGDA